MKEKQIHFEKVTYDNVGKIVNLRVAKNQRDYVASNRESLIQAYLCLADGDPVYPFGIYNGTTLVGFIMINYSTDWSGYKHEAWLNSDTFRLYQGKPYYYIWRLMIDKKFQNRGYGREAMRCALDFIRTKPCGEADYCLLSYEPSNVKAKGLYASCGFEEINGPGYYEEDDEVSAMLKL